MVLACTAVCKGQQQTRYRYRSERLGRLRGFCLLFFLVDILGGRVGEFVINVVVSAGKALTVMCCAFYV